jgi:outer membrane protein assembly factor BamB
MCWLLLLTLGWTSVLSVAQAQFPFGLNPGRTESSQSTTPFDPQLLAELERGRVALSRGRIAEGIETLQSLLDRGEDFLLPEERQVPSPPVPRADGEPQPAGEKAPLPAASRPLTLLSAIERMLAEQLTEYERQYGTEAKTLLDYANESQDVAVWQDVTRRFGLTLAGASAMELMARRHLHLGDPVAAARWWERLLRHPQRAEQQPAAMHAAIKCWMLSGQVGEATRLLGEFPDVMTRIVQTQQWPAVDQQNPAEWLARVFPVEPASGSRLPLLLDWTVPAGHISQAHRSLPAAAAALPVWEHPLIDEFDELPEESLRFASERLMTAQADLDSTRKPGTFPVARPLVVGDIVVVPGYGSLRAYHRETGELLWPAVVIDDTFDFLFRASYAPGHPLNSDSSLLACQDFFFKCRGYRDLTSASISSDGRLVYAVLGNRLPATKGAGSLLVTEVRDPRLPMRDNQVHAFDLRTGALVWSIMGEAQLDGDDLLARKPQERSAIFFYGAPLPVAGRLFCIGEERGQIQLFELNPRTVLEGEILWSVPLHNPLQGQDIQLESSRRLAGLMPAYAGGLLICPTGCGTVVALDIEQRRIVWQHRYLDTGPTAATLNRIARFNQRQVRGTDFRDIAAELLNEDRWQDARLLVAGERVLYTTPDSAELICIGLHDGRPQWQRPLPRSAGLSLAGVYEDSAILVDSGEIRLIRLADGSPVWSVPATIPAPSGRGLRSGDQFLQPVVTGELIVMDLRSGQINCRLPLPVEETAVNLVEAHGQIVLQSATRVVALESRERQQQELATLPAAERLAREGVQLMQLGDLETGLPKLREAAVLGAPERYRQVLGWRYVEMLAADFGKHRGLLEEIEGYCITPEQRQKFLMTVAAGLSSTGEPAQALEVFLRLLREAEGEQDLEDVDPQWQVRYDRRLAGQLHSLRSEADFERLIVQHLESLSGSDSAWSAMRLLGGGSVPAEILRGALLPEQSGSVESLPQRESLALAIAQSSSATLRSLGQYLLAILSLQQQDALTAAGYLRKLEQADPAVPVLNGRSGPELARDVSESAEWKTLLSGARPWPRYPHVDEGRTGGVTGLARVPVFGAADDALAGWSFHVASSGESLQVYDADGAPWGNVPTKAGGNRTGAELVKYVQVRGHLAVVVCEDRLLVLRMDPRRRKAELLQNIAGPSAAEPRAAALRGINALGVQDRPGLRGVRARSWFPDAGWGMQVGPLLEGLLCYTHGTDLWAIDPLTGEKLWRRRQIPAGAQLIGDDQYVVVISFEEQTYTVLRALDGALLREGGLPDETVGDWEGIDWGRLIPVRRVIDDQLVLEVLDPVTGELAWKMPVGVGESLAGVAGNSLGYLNSAGEFARISVRTGETLWKTPLPGAEGTLAISCHGHGEQLICVQHAGELREGIDPALGTPDLAGTQIRLTALDAQSGTIRWQREFLEPGEYSLPELPGRWPLHVLLRQTFATGTSDFTRSRALRPTQLTVLQADSGRTVTEIEGRANIRQFSWKGEPVPYHRIRLACSPLPELFFKCLDTPPAETATAPGSKAAPEQSE